MPGIITFPTFKKNTHVSFVGSGGCGGGRAFLVVQMVKNLPAMQKTQGVIPGSGKVPWRREWLPPPVSLPGEFHGQGSLVG